MGGKSSDTPAGYRYRVAFHAGIGLRADALLDFRVAQKVAWSGRQTATGTISINVPQLFGGDTDQGGVVGDMDLMLGMPDQQPNPYLAATFGARQPGWRGVVTAAYKGGQFGSNNPYAQKFDFLIEAIKNGWGLHQDATECWYPEKAAVPMALGIDLLGAGWEYQIETFAEPNTVWNNWTIPADGWLQGGEMPFASAETFNGHGWEPMRSNIWLRRQVSFNVAGVTLNIGADNGCVVFADGVQIGSSNPTNANIPNNQENPVSFTPALRGTKSIVIKGYSEVNASSDTGNIVQVEFAGAPGNAMNPAHILYYARTHPDMGREPVSAMNDASYKAAADWFYAHGIGLCTQYDASQESVEDFCQRIGKVAGCGDSRDPTTGQWMLDIANGVYDLASLPILTDDDVLEFSEQPTTLDQAINSVSVEYYDPSNDVTRVTPPAQALGLVAAFGVRHQVNQYHEIPTADLAAQIAQRDLMNATTPTHGYDLTTTTKPAKWRVNTYFRLQLPRRGIADMVCMLGEKNGGTLPSGAIKITAVEDIYSLPQANFIKVEPNVDTRPPQIPTAIAVQAAIEAPYIDVVRRLSRGDLAALQDDAGYLETIAQDPSQSRDYTLVVSSDGGATYTGAATGYWCPTATIVEGDPLSGAAPQTAFTLTGASRLDSVVVGSAGLWDGEIVRIDAIDAAAGTLTIARGCADTVPHPHTANSRIWFFDGFAGTDAKEYADGESIDVKLLTNTGSARLAVEDAAALPLTFSSRQARPYPPVGLTVNGDPWYAPSTAVDSVVLAWNSRNRVTQADQLIGANEPSIAAETGTTYRVDTYLNGALDSSMDGITELTASPVISGAGTVKTVVTSVRSGLNSRESSTAIFNFTTSVLSLSGAYPAATIGVAYDADIDIVGGRPPYSNPRVTAGTLPPGLGPLTINDDRLHLAGTPTGTTQVYDFTVAVDSADDQTASIEQSIAVSVAVPGVWDATKVPSAIIRTSDTVITGGTGIGHYASAGSTVGKSSGKWLFQVTGSTNDYFAGIACIDGANSPWTSNNALGYDIVGAAIACENYNGAVFACKQSTAFRAKTAVDAHAAASQPLTIAVDLDNGTFKVFVGDTAGASIAIPAQLLGLTWYPSASVLSKNNTATLNCGQTAIAIPSPLTGQGYNPFWQ